jgi:phosphatidylserine/phosphatidylglycerophosphate/cardiolipin synthase-like enzyme
VREVERLYVDLIAAAERSIYIENQYFTSPAIGDALAARLSEPNGPEIVIVVRLLSHGWLEGAVMQTLRARLMRRLREKDRYNKLHVFYPHVSDLQPGTCIDVHAKLAIMDDEWLRIGSANLANRSMGYDSECDLTVAARGDSSISAAIHRVRTLLLSEHLGASPEQVARDLQRTHSIAETARNIGTSNRCLLELTTEPEVSDALIGIAGAADLEHPMVWSKYFRRTQPLTTNLTSGAILRSTAASRSP